MANQRKVGLKIEIDGEKEYKQAISELNKGNQVLASELRKVSEQYKGNEDSIEALNARGDVLRRQLQQQEDKVKALRAALQNAASQYGEADKRTQEWQVQLNNAETQEIKLRRALDETNKEIEQQGSDTQEAGQKMATLGDQVSGLADKFGIRLPDSIKGALDHVDGFSTGTVAAMGAAAAGIGAVKLAIDGIKAGIKAVQKLNEMTLEQAHWADDLLTQSAQTGLDTTLLQQLDYASKFLDFDGIDKSLVKLTQSMDSARDGAEKQSAAFQALGVSVTDADGNLRDNWETFKDVIDALGTVENATERDVLANDLFGKSYSELKPLIDAGTGALQEMMDTAEESGYVLDESQVKKLGEVDDAYQEYQTQIEAVKKKLAVEFAPVSTAVMEKFGELAMQAGEKITESGILSKLDGFLEPLGKIGESLLKVADVVLPAAGWALKQIAGIFAAVAETIAQVVQQAEAAYNWIQEKDAAWQLNDSSGYYVDDYNPAFAGYNAAGDRNWRGGLTWVGEGGPELAWLPQGSQIYSSQESSQIAAAAGGSGTDTRALEASVQENTAMLRAILSELGGMQIRGRMYG